MKSLPFRDTLNHKDTQFYLLFFNIDTLKYKSENNFIWTIEIII